MKWPVQTSYTVIYEDIRVAFSHFKSTNLCLRYKAGWAGGIVIASCILSSLQMA